MRLLLRLILVLVIMLCLSSCAKSADQKAYEDIIAIKSMEKARRFFDHYPQNPYKDKLIKEIIERCRQEGTESCYRMAIEAIPKDYPQRKEFIVYYEKYFVENK